MNPEILKMFVPERYLSMVRSIVFDFKDYTIYKATNDKDESTKIMRSISENF